MLYILSHQILFLSFIENKDTFKNPNINEFKSNFAIMFLITAKN